MSTAVPSGPTSPYETYASDYNPSDLEKNVSEFDKQFKNSQNLDIAKKDHLSKRWFSGGIAEKLPACFGLDINVAQGKTAANPQGSMKTVCDLVVSGGKIASGMNQMQDPSDQTIQCEQSKDPVSKMEGARSTTPSLHLLYEEPW